MAYAFVQQNAADNAAGATTITVTLTPTAGNLLVFAVSGDSLDTTSIALSDNLGTHNTFTQIGTDLVTAVDQRCAWWFAANCKGGATTFTATFSASTRFRTIYVAEYSGIATSNPFLNGTRAEQTNPGTGTDAVSSGNANATSQPALVWGFSIDANGGTTPNAGTGFTARTGVWSTATCLGRGEDKRVTATGNVAATWTATTGTDDHASGVGIFAEAAATPTVSGWAPDFPDRFPPRMSVSALGVAVAPVIVAALVPLCWAPSFQDSAPGRPALNQATGVAVEPVFVPPSQPPATPMSWSPEFPDFASRARQPVITGGSFAPEATLPNPPPPALSWSPEFPDTIPRARAALLADGMVEPVAPNAVPSLTSWESGYPDMNPRARAAIQSAVGAPTLPQPNPPASIFPLSISSDNRYLRKVDGTPFLIKADTTWSLFVDIPLTGTRGIDAFLTTITGQGFNAVSGNVIEHHYTVVKPPKNQNSDLPFTKTLNGSTYTGSPNGTTSSNGTQGQFASDNYSNINTQAPDPTFINNVYWQACETILNSCLSHNVAVFVWPFYLGFHAGDEGWMQELVAWDAVTGAGGFTGFSFANASKSKAWNYGAWLADRWKAYPHIIWVAGGDYGSGSQTLDTQQKAAVESVISGMKSVAGQQSVFWTAHWDRDSISTDTALTSVTFDINGSYCAEAVAERTRAAYAHSPVSPACLIEWFYENDLFGGSAPYRKYMYWGYLGGIAGGFFGNEQIWRFDDGTPGTDFLTLETTQATLDAVRMFAFWDARPWHRLKPSGLGGMGTLVTAGGGTASPQSTDYVAAAATPEGDLLLAYVPPAHTGSVTIDMTKLGASVTARWWDPTNATFTAIGTFANTGTHAFTTPGNNSAGDTDWLLVLEAPNAPMELSWGPSFPDRCLRAALTTAQVVSGVVEPVAPPPPPTLANWSPEFPDAVPRVDRMPRIGGLTTPEATLPDAPALSWNPSFPDRLSRPVSQPYVAGAVVPPTDTNAGPLTWSPDFPDRAPGRARVTLGGPAGPPSDTNAGPLTWAPVAPDRVPGRPRVTLGGETAPPADRNAGPLTWAPSYPDRVLGRPRTIESGAVAQIGDVTAALLSWQPVAAIPAPRRQIIVGGETAPVPVPPAVPSLSWAPSFPDRAPVAPRAVLGEQVAPDVILPNAAAPAMSWEPAFPDAVPRARAAPIIGGATKPEAVLPNAPSPLLAWAPSFPDRLVRARATQIVGGPVQPEATLPNAPAPTLPWAPSFPDAIQRPRAAQIAGGMAAPNAAPVPLFPAWVADYPDMAPRARGAQIAGGLVGPDTTLPNPPAPEMSWLPVLHDLVWLVRRPVLTGGISAPPFLAPPPVIPDGHVRISGVSPDPEVYDWSGSVPTDDTYGFSG